MRARRLACLSLSAMLLSGCSHLSGSVPPPSPALKVLVGPITMRAPISKSTKIYSFEQAPSPELEPTIRRQLIEEVEAKAQRFLTEHLSGRPGFTVVPFEDARRLQADIGRGGVALSDELSALGAAAGADIVLSGTILDFGAVQPKYWVTGLVLHSGAGLLVLGFATGWNPVAIGAYLAWESPDILIWGGGAYVLGWAFRPVRVEVKGFQLAPCHGEIWIDQELKVTVPRKALAEYPPEQRRRKEVQLEVNLKTAMEEVAEHVGEELRLQPCTQEGRPAKRKKLGLLTLLGLGH